MMILHTRTWPEIRPGPFHIIRICGRRSRNTLPAFEGARSAWNSRRSQAVNGRLERHTAVRHAGGQLHRTASAATAIEKVKTL